MNNANGTAPLSSAHPLLERGEYLRELDRYLSEAAAGRGSVVLLGGNAGIGKTALVREFSREAGGRVRVLVGACDALSTTEPLAPLFDIMAGIGPEALEQLENADSRLSRFRTFLAMLANTASLVVFEDVHWADEATLDLLRFAGRRIEGTRSLIVATYRNDEVGPGHPLRVVFGDLATLGLSHRMTLPALTIDAVRTLAGASDIDPSELHRLTGGNAFFVTEVLATGMEGIPATVRDAVLARAYRLSHNGRATLDAAAVIGSPGEVWLLNDVLTPGQNAIDECVAAGMLMVERDSYHYRHEIARQAILSSLAPQERLSLHARVLSSLESSPSGRSRLAHLAHHAEESGQRDAVLRYAPEAARNASGLSAHREAAAQFERALRFADDMAPVERAHLLDEYAQECYLTDWLDAAIQARRDALEIWRQLGEPLREGETLFWMSRVLVLAGRNAEAEEASLKAIDVLEAQPPSPELASAYQIQAHLRMLNRDNQEAIERGKQAIELAARLEAHDALIYAHNTVGSAMLLSEENEGRRYLERSVQLAREAGLDDYVAAAYGNLGSGSGEIYKFEQADQYLAEGIAYCDERDLDFERNYMLAWQALSHFYQGRWSEAAATAASLLRLPNLAVISRIMAQVALGRVRARRGDPEVMTVLDEALKSARQTATLQRLGPVHAARAEAALLQGNVEATADEARAAYDLAVEQGHRWFVGEFAYWRWRAGDLDTAPDIAAKPFMLQIAGEWEAAANCWRELNCPYEAARALAESNQESELLQALEAFDRLGASPARAAVAQRLREIGVQAIPRGARPSTRANPAGLTRRQMEVAELIAGGLTNRDIAERLYISPKTVENHVTDLFAKLDVNNRIEARRELARIGITATK